MHLDGIARSAPLNNKITLLLISIALYNAAAYCDLHKIFLRGNID